jgi:hypothetical protein
MATTIATPARARINDPPDQLGRSPRSKCCEVVAPLRRTQDHREGRMDRRRADRRSILHCPHPVSRSDYRVRLEEAGLHRGHAQACQNLHGAHRPAPPSHAQGTRTHCPSPRHQPKGSSVTEPDPSPPVAETLARLQLTLKARQTSAAHSLITRARIKARNYPSEATLPPRISRKKGKAQHGSEEGS